MKRHVVAVGVLVLGMVVAGPAAATGSAATRERAGELVGTLAFERYHAPANSEWYAAYSYLVRLAADGSSEQVLTGADLEQERVPSWSPDGSKLAYTGEPGWDLYIVGRDGGEPVQLTRGTDSEDWWPTWSPDGKRLAFYRRSYTTGKTRLYSIGADGTGMRPLTDGSWSDATAAWSPDGKWIAFSRYDPSGDAVAGWHIWAVRPDGSGLRRLTAGRLQSWRPSWSPDGKWIAFGGWYRSEREEKIYSDTDDIYVMPATGGKPRPVTSGAAYDMEPCWSPDSDRIAFTRTPADVWIHQEFPYPVGDWWLGYGAPADIFSVRRDGTDLRQITNTAVSEEGCTWTR